ncbi:hypothetical protein [Nocardiopsis sp. CC223A]|uniref:hypothetical protein n=1 Tax=Nocardiopsis sp. CC223A TaxID=3044051 RepID=UPI00278C77F4|nr:hypothetical protein [Nocardiopsis sp. CC223A]
MSTEGTGANTWEAATKGEQAAALAEAMVGLDETFSSLMDDIAGKAGWIASGYLNFKFELEPEIATVQRNGLSLADSIQSGASEIARNDHESSDGFVESWHEMPEINF